MGHGASLPATQPPATGARRIRLARGVLVGKCNRMSGQVVQTMKREDLRLESEAKARLADYQEKLAARRLAGPISAVSDQRKTRSQTAAELELEPVSDELEEIRPTQALLPLFVKDLFDFQLHGVKWVLAMCANGYNCLLADDMGLGKTAQAIGVMSSLMHKGVVGAYMIVAPFSVVDNWAVELERFLPSRKVVIYRGKPPERLLLQQTSLKHLRGTLPLTADFPIIIVPYEIYKRDHTFFMPLQFAYVVVDEAHNLKDPSNELTKELKKLKTKGILLLTGTPVQNQMRELFSLFNYMAPDMFPYEDDFKQFFDIEAIVKGKTPEERVEAAQQGTVMIKAAHSVIGAFTLRRTKAEELDLPPRQQFVLYAPMTAAQAKIHHALVKHIVAANRRSSVKHLTVARVEGEAGVVVDTLKIGQLHNVFMQLRKNCNSPTLVKDSTEPGLPFPSPEVMRNESGKLDLVFRLLEFLSVDGHKTLIFSQMTSMLDILEHCLVRTGKVVCRIDGDSTWEQRVEAIKKFHSDPSILVFLLSTKAGGVGLNIVGADTVILYDSDWNPNGDKQAMDRCYRIGQKFPVLVFRLATANSVDGHIIRTAAEKISLERLVMKRGEFKHETEEGEGKEGVTSQAELWAILENTVTLAGGPQSGVADDNTLKMLLDRKHMLRGTWDPADLPYPASGVGYEVVPGDPILVPGARDNLDVASSSGSSTAAAGSSSGPVGIGSGGPAVGGSGSGSCSGSGGPVASVRGGSVAIGVVTVSEEAGGSSPPPFAASGSAAIALAAGDITLVSVGEGSATPSVSGSPEL